MVYGHPKTPLFRVDGERGFVFCGPAQTCEKNVGIKAGISRRSQQRRSHIEVRVYDDYDDLVGCYVVNDGKYRSIVDKLN